MGDLYYPVHKGRDGCRTPMPWQAGAPNHGFTTGTPWLPAAAEHAGLTTDVQNRDPDSVLNFARRLIAARQDSGALKWGEIEFLDAPAPILAFRRAWRGETVVCAFNMGGAPVRWPDPPADAGAGPDGLELNPHGGWLSGG